LIINYLYVTNCGIASGPAVGNWQFAVDQFFDYLRLKIAALLLDPAVGNWQLSGAKAEAANGTEFGNSLVASQ
jgi:hypothetical protein